MQTKPADNQLLVYIIFEKEVIFVAKTSRPVTEKKYTVKDRDPKTGKFLPGNQGGGKRLMPESLLDKLVGWSEKALEVTASMLDDPNVRPQERLRATEIILDRTYGRPHQSTEAKVETEGTIIVTLGNDLDEWAK